MMKIVYLTRLKEEYIETSNSIMSMILNHSTLYHTVSNQLLSAYCGQKKRYMEAFMPYFNIINKTCFP